jgi:hypothetical protein
VWLQGAFTYRPPELILDLCAEVLSRVAIYGDQKFYWETGQRNCSMTGY